MTTGVPTHLAENVKQLREAQGLTQEQAARLSDIPRATWATLESGSANPTLAVLIKVAGALQVSIEELIGPPRSSGRLYPADEIRTRRRSGVTVRTLLPEPIAGLEIERMELPAGAQMKGIPHTPGTREYLTCEQGRLELRASGETWELSRGDVVAFRGDQRHTYRNPGGDIAVAYSVVALEPAEG